MMTKQQKAAEEFAELTFVLLNRCQKKEELLANELNITVSEFHFFWVFRGSRRYSMKTLLKKINLSSSRLTRILDSLERKGYLTRSADPVDRRNISVTLSKKGVELSRLIENNTIKIYEGILGGIPSAVQPSFIGGLQNMVTALTIQ